jgi:uncharacterized damage-inducible protein DinB
MDLLDRLLGHDAWTTRQLLARCRELSDDQLDQPLEIDHGSLRATLGHMIANVEVWTDLIVGREPRTSQGDRSLVALIERHDQAMTEFAEVARSIRDRALFDALWTDVLDDPPVEKSYGGAIGHVLTHNMHHRAYVIEMLGKLGVENLIEGDLLSWEMQLER